MLTQAWQSHFAFLPCGEASQRSQKQNQSQQSQEKMKRESGRLSVISIQPCYIWMMRPAMVTIKATSARCRVRKAAHSGRASGVAKEKQRKAFGNDNDSEFHSIAPWTRHPSYEKSNVTSDQCSTWIEQAACACMLLSQLASGDILA